MKRRIVSILLVLVLASMLCMSSFAAEFKTGFCSLTYDEAKVTATPQDADGNTIAANTTYLTNDTLYEKAVKLHIEVTSPTDGTYYLILAETEKAVPTGGTNSNIVYIDQKTAEDGKVSFDVYPIGLVPDQTYYVFLTSSIDAENTAYLEKVVASFKYHSDHMMGDLDGDSNFSSTDASIALQIAALIKTNIEEWEKTAADVDQDGYVTSVDASLILQRAAQLITEFKPANSGS